MQKLVIVIFFFFAPVVHSQTSAKQKSKIILDEYSEIRKYVETLVPDETLGHFYKIKYFEDYQIIWNFIGAISRNEYITIYRPKSPKGVKPELYFAVTYRRSSQIRPTRIVLRREWGFWPYDFRYDTVDVKSSKYLGRQGLSSISYDQRDQEILDKYNIQLFLD